MSRVRSDVRPRWAVARPNSHSARPARTPTARGASEPKKRNGAVTRIARAMPAELLPLDRERLRWPVRRRRRLAATGVTTSVTTPERASAKTHGAGVLMRIAPTTRALPCADETIGGLCTTRRARMRRDHVGISECADGIAGGVVATFGQM